MEEIFEVGLGEGEEPVPWGVVLLMGKTWSVSYRGN